MATTKNKKTLVNFNFTTKDLQKTWAKIKAEYSQYFQTNKIAKRGRNLAFFLTFLTVAIYLLT
jgi:hypothetical protein